MAVETTLSFPATGPEGPHGKPTKIKIKLNVKKQPDGKLTVTQVEFEAGNAPPVKFPDPPGGDGTPPNDPPKLSAPDPGLTVVKGAVRKPSGGADDDYWFVVACSLEPPLVSFHHRVTGADGKVTDTVTNYEIDHGTQDVLVSWLTDKGWHWLKPATPTKDGR